MPGFREYYGLAHEDESRSPMPGLTSNLTASGSGNNMDCSRSSARYAFLCVFGFALLLLFWKAMIVFGNPSFKGDAAVRMLSAARPIARMGNRVWLPYLQIQIWGLAKLGIPYPYFNLIPCLHLFLATLGLGLLGLRFLGRDRRSLLISLIFMFCFAQQQVIGRISSVLLQEITAIALFYLLVHGGALELAKRRWMLAAGAAALLARDSVWIYLISLTLLNWRTILSDIRYRRCFAILWTIPPLWLAAVFCGWGVFEGRFPSFRTEWPLMINKEANQAVSSLTASLQHLWKSALESRVHYLVFAGLAAWLIHAIESKHLRMRSMEAAGFARHLRSFTLLSLSICYGHIFLFDPWQLTSGSGRMFTPIIEQCFLWFLLAAAAARFYRPAARTVTMTVLLAGMLASLDVERKDWIPAPNSVKVSAYEEIAARVNAAAPGRRPMACMIGNYFYEMSDYSAAVYRASHKLLPIGLQRIPDDCDALFTAYENEPNDPGELVREKEYRLDDRHYVLFVRRR